MSIVAIVGRPNVGKSTLFNRILGRRRAIVEDFPGVTRDRNYAEVTRFESPFTLIDTGGFEPVSQERLLVQMREQSQLAVEDADVILFVMDGKEGLTPSDEEVAQLLRQAEKPVLFVVNKVDGEKQELGVAEFYGLGVDQIFSISAEHGRGIGDLIEALLRLLPKGQAPRDRNEEVRLAIVGRPNVGKSSLVNRMVGYERVVANAAAGTTRDSIDTPFTYNGKPYLLIDTAGIRRKGRVSQRLEKYSVIQALKAMDRAHVVLVVIDAEEGVTDQDLTVAGYAHEKGRAVVLLVNKWDLVEKDKNTMGEFVERLSLAFKFLPTSPILFVSALSGQRVSKTMNLVERVAAEHNRKVSTSALNKVLANAERTHPPPMFQGKRLKFFYATQTAVRPPTFVIFVNRADGVHFSYQRYLVNQFRDVFGFEGTPIRLVFKDRER
ncbi:MAG: ribosome biogenesis GTPase Der [Desulfuromonas sp.]|uniref:ribosome biogenesis GTPase Der n=1 Tax=Desulfuromonas sp. TaxID=892 RepID=UPI000CBBF8EA|nr:ribosome biogenesis GTPase Der [Desulfuromonas sp.]PLX82579.1 MAG: ribosome biogenesis GTPase Der [Desulfuromonas sp.]